VMLPRRSRKGTKDMVRIGKHNIDRKWFTRKRVIVICIVAFLILAFLYYHEKKKLLAEMPVVVVQVEEKTVPLYFKYVGNTAAVKTVDIRARVEGFLLERNFVEGDDVNEGDLMYLIDPKPFEAALEEAKGQFEKDRAALAYAEEQVARYSVLVEKDYVSREDYDNMVTTMEQAKGALDSSKGQLEQAELNLGYCRMYAPFDGRIGRTLVNVGNLVGAGQDTKLATLVQLDPIYVYFSPSEEDVTKILTEKGDGELPLELYFTDDTKFSQQGRVDFIDNEVDVRTSTLAMRGVFSNPDKTLLPGIYVKTWLHLKDIPDALLVPEKSIAEDQSGQYVMLVGENDVASKSYIETADLYDDMRHVTKGVKAGQRVITEGQQMVTPGSVVWPMEKGKEDTIKGLVMEMLMD